MKIAEKLACVGRAYLEHKETIDSVSKNIALVGVGSAAFVIGCTVASNNAKKIDAEEKEKTKEAVGYYKYIDKVADNIIMTNRNGNQQEALEINQHYCVSTETNGNGNVYVVPSKATFSIIKDEYDTYKKETQEAKPE